MADHLTVRLTGDEQARRDVRRIQVGLDDLRPFWGMLRPVAGAWFREQFATQGGFGGFEWAPLSPAYARQKVRQWGDRPLLVASGDLRKRVQRPASKVTTRTLEVWINDDATKNHGPGIAGYHQEGNSHMPPRPLIFTSLPAAAVLDLHEVANGYIRFLINRSIAFHFLDTAA